MILASNTHDYLPLHTPEPIPKVPMIAHSHYNCRVDADVIPEIRSAWVIEASRVNDNINLSAALLQQNSSDHLIVNTNSGVLVWTSAEVRQLAVPIFQAESYHLDKPTQRHTRSFGTRACCD